MSDIYQLFHGNQTKLFDYFKENSELLHKYMQIYHDSYNVNIFTLKNNIDVIQTPFLYAVELQNYKFITYFFKLSKENFQFYDQDNERTIFHFLLLKGEVNVNVVQIKILKFLLKNIHIDKLKVLLNHRPNKTYYGTVLQEIARHNWKIIPKHLIQKIIDLVESYTLIRSLFTSFHHEHWINILILLKHQPTINIYEIFWDCSFFDYVMYQHHKKNIKCNKIYQKMIDIFQQQYIGRNNYYCWIYGNVKKNLLLKIIDQYTSFGFESLRLRESTLLLSNY